MVALAELASSVDAEAPALAEDLGSTAYDARLLLAPGLPAVVRTTPDRANALDLLARLRARGHGAVACDASAVVPSADMISMKRFRLTPATIVLADREGLELPYDEVLAIVAAVHRTRTEVETHVKEKRFSVSRAALTSGLSMTRTVSTETHSATEDREPVLYVFPRSGATPWILRESAAEWTGHGQPLRPTRAENFHVATSELRARAPAAVFDDRLVTRKARETASLRSTSHSTAGEGPRQSTRVVTSSSEGMVDLLAHLIALWIARSARL